MQKIIIVTGQTATGKTRKALELAAKYNGELINCDSRQIYKKLDIVTGKDFTDKNFVLVENKGIFDIGYYPVKFKYQKSWIRQAHQDPEQQLNGLKGKSGIQTSKSIDENRQLYSIPVWLYDVVDPKQNFSAYEYRRLALNIILDIYKRGKTPIIVGGAGYYLYHLLSDISTSGIPQDWELRKKLSKFTIQDLQKEFKTIDLHTYDKLNNSEKNNPQRLIRKIEIARYQKKHKKIKKKDYTGENTNLLKKLREHTLIYSCIEKDKVKLESSIKVRVDKRLKQGAIEETANLLKMGYSKADPGLKTIGYAQIIEYLEGKLSADEMKQQWIVKEMQYAKRQATFIKKYIYHITSAFW